MYMGVIVLIFRLMFLHRFLLQRTPRRRCSRFSHCVYRCTESLGLLSWANMDCGYVFKIAFLRNYKNVPYIYT